METTKTKNIAVLFLFILGLSGLVNAGFGSTYLPEIDGTPTLILDTGETSSYFIYPQNSDSESRLIKIEITDENNLIKNKLEESYEIPPYTESDDFPIELKISLPSNVEKGEVFSIEYSVLAKEDKLNGGMVNFNPTGYYKKINVQVQEIKSNHNKIYLGIGILFIILISIGGIIYGKKNNNQ